MHYDHRATDASVLPPGTYTAIIDAATEGKSGPNSKSPGADMITLELEIIAGNNTARVWDRITLPAATWKLGQLAKAIGQQKAFESDEFRADDYRGRSCLVDLEIDPGNGQFPPSNRVKKYRADPSANHDGSGPLVPGTVPPMPFPDTGDGDVPF